MNYRLNGSDLLRVIEHCAPACLITTAEKMDALTGATVPRVLTVDDAAASGSFWDEVEQGSSQFNSIGCQSSDIANLLYTSGTTSTPKAAIHTHGMRVAVAGAMADCFKLSRADIALASVADLSYQRHERHEQRAIRRRHPSCYRNGGMLPSSSVSSRRNG